NIGDPFRVAELLSPWRHVVIADLDVTVAAQKLAVLAPATDDGALARCNIRGGGAVRRDVGYDLRAGRDREAHSSAFAYQPAVAHYVSCSDWHVRLAAFCSLQMPRPHPSRRLPCGQAPQDEVKH